MLLEYRCGGLFRPHSAEHHGRRLAPGRPPGLYIAQDDGLFARQGLHVTIEQLPSSQVVTAQLKGQVEVSAQSYLPYIEAQAAGARFRILAEASTLSPGTRTLVVTAASHITSIAGLARQKIGVNGTNSIGTL